MIRNRLASLSIALLLFAFPGCQEKRITARPEPAAARVAPAPFEAAHNTNSMEVRDMKISSSAFGDHRSIPSKYTCDGDDIIPPLAFEGIPDGTVTLALVMDDPDVPPPGSGRVWDHWVVWNLPPETRSIEEGQPPTGVQGRNSWGRNDWGGPCPPDREHRYFFKLYALDMTLDLPDTAGKKELEAAMKGHIQGTAELVGLYNRKH